MTYKLNFLSRVVSYETKFIGKTWSFCHNYNKLRCNHFSDIPDETKVTENNRDFGIRRWTLPGHVYFVSTPIGNLHDISERAKIVLRDVDVICCEDTRTTRSLLNLLEVPYRNKTLLSHHLHNERASTLGIVDIAKIKNQSIAVVSDAGTPGIADPGSRLASSLLDANVPIHPVPGPSALSAALSVSGMPAPFTFLGFLPSKGRERREMIQFIANTPHTIIFFEAPHRIKKTLMDISEKIPNDRLIVICRELTKLHEEIKKGTISDFIKDIEIASPTSARGEFTVILGPIADDANRNLRHLRSEVDSMPAINDESTFKSATSDSNSGNGSGYHDDLIRQLRVYKSEGKLRSEAARLTSEKLNIPKGIAYKAALKIQWD